MRQGKMRNGIARRRGVGAIALTGAVIMLGAGTGADPAVAAAQVPAAEVDNRSGWAAASGVEDSANVPSLTSELETPDSSSSGVWLGYGLVGAGLLALAVGLTAPVLTQRPAPGRPGTDIAAPGGHPAAETYPGP